MTTSKQAMHGLFWSAAERMATQGISFAVAMLLARLIGPHSYGLVALAATIALFGQIMLGDTFSQALIQEKSVTLAHSSSVFWFLAGLGLLASAAQLCTATVAAQALNMPDAAPIIAALCPLPFLSALQAVPTALLRRELNFRAIFLSSTAGTLIGGVTAVIMALTGFGIWSLVANLLIQNAILAVTIWHRSGFKPALEFSQPHLSALWFYAKYTFLSRLAIFAGNQFPRLIVGYLFGPVVLGSFSLGMRIIETLYQLLVMPAVNVIVPVIARIRENPQRVEAAILGATHMTAVLSAAVYGTLATTAPLAIPLVFGAKWTASIPLVQLLCAFGMIVSCGLIWQSILGGLGRPDISLRVTITAAIANIGALVLGAHWGPLAAAGAFVFRGYVTFPFMPLIIARLTGLPATRQYAVFLPVAVAACIMIAVQETALTILAHRWVPALLIGFTVAAGAVAYGLTLYLLDKRALKKGLSTLRHLRPQQAAA